MKLTFADYAACVLQTRGDALPTRNRPVRVRVGRIQASPVPGADLLIETLPRHQWVTLVRNPDASFGLIH